MEKKNRMMEWMEEAKYGLFAVSDGGTNMSIAMSVGGKPVRSLEAIGEEDFLRLLNVANSLQTVFLNEYFRRHPEKNAELDAFMAKGGVA